MPGKTIVITGASDGIGAAAARRLCDQGETVVLVGRSSTKTAAIADELDVDSFVADYGDFSAVRDLASELRRRYPRIDVLANNAGGMAGAITHTGDGYEKLLQVNYLAPFLLTTQLLDVLTDSHATVLGTSSASHKMLGKVDVDDLLNTQRYRPNKAYALTKLGIILFARELHRRYHERGLATAAFHPGWIRSNIGPASGSSFLAMVHQMPLIGRLGKEPDVGADQLVWLSTSIANDEWKSGEYYSGGRIAKANRNAYDDRLARALWDRTLEMVAT